MKPIKLIVSSHNNLSLKYGKQYSGVIKLLQQIKAADKKKAIDTRIVLLDDPTSTKAAGIKAISSVTPKTCKESIDQLNKKCAPAYIMIFGAQDIIPFHEITNPASGDDDDSVPSDLPYACDSAYSTNIGAFTGPTRVVGRLPDVPGKQDNIDYVKILIHNCISVTPRNADAYQNYFSLTAEVWKGSTQESLKNIFGNFKELIDCPARPAHKPGYTAKELQPLTHFYNCHGAQRDAHFYGQRGDDYPVAMDAAFLTKKISKDTIVAAECCYGAGLFKTKDVEPNSLSIANSYLGEGAIAFLGSSTIAYGPADGQGLADLITQYFIKNVLAGASTGRAFLEARQRFLSSCGPHLDPFELKTLAQFYLLGDPSIQPIKPQQEPPTEAPPANSVQNNRIKLVSKGISLQQSTTPSKLIKNAAARPSKSVKSIVASEKFDNAEQHLYEVKPRTKGLTGMQKAISGGTARFRTFTKPNKNQHLFDIKVLVIKENDEQVLGYRVYESR